MKRFLFLALFPLFAYGQDSATLKTLYGQLSHPSDSARFVVHDKISDEWLGANLDSPLYHADRMLEIAEKLKDPVRKRKAYTQKGLAHGYLHRFEDELRYYRKALEITPSVTDKRGLGVLYLNMGVSYLYQGILDSAAYYYQQARPCFEAVRDSAKISIIYNNLGLVYRKVKRYDEAIGMYRASIEIKEHLDDKIGLLNTYLNLTSLYTKRERYTQALTLTDKILQLSDTPDLTDYYISGLINAGIAHKNLEDYAAATREFEEAQKLLSRVHDPQLGYETHFNLAELAHTIGKTDKALHNLKETEKWFGQYKDLEAIKAYYHLSYEVYKSMGKAGKALAQLEKYTEANEQFLNEQSLEQINELQSKYEFEKKDRQIAQLELDKRTSELQYAWSQNQRNLFMSATFVVLILAGFFFNRYHTKKKNSQLLEQKNVQITRALEERETLLREIHHRVKNNLQVITSLLNLQSATLKDTAAADAVKESQNRVRSMSLIHQKLYQMDDVRAVDVGDYLDNLIQALLQSYGKDESEIAYILDTNRLKLDIDTVIPLGLIINELVTNAIKYAFDGQEKGELRLGLFEKDRQLIVEIKDNGSGLDTASMDKPDSFGWKMIRSLSRKLKASIDVENTPGTCIRLSIQRYKLVS